MKAIRQERKVELAYEGHYYWDMRRWKLSATAFTGIRLHGMKIEKMQMGLSLTFIQNVMIKIVISRLRCIVSQCHRQSWTITVR